MVMLRMRIVVFRILFFVTFFLLFLRSLLFLNVVISDSWFLSCETGLSHCLGYADCSLLVCDGNKLVSCTLK